VWSRTALSAVSGGASRGIKAQSWKEGFWEDEACGMTRKFRERGAVRGR
jgi:hypothetical protein